MIYRRVKQTYRYRGVEGADSNFVLNAASQRQHCLHLFRRCKNSDMTAVPAIAYAAKQTLELTYAISACGRKLAKL